MKVILAIAGGILLGYSMGYWWRGKNRPKEIDNLVALTLMPIVGITAVLMSITL